MNISDSVKRVARTWVISFLGLYVPAIVGFLGSLTSWANAHGQEPFPDLSLLAYAGVSAIAASFVALLNLIVNKGEDAAGKSLPGILSRPVQPVGAAVPTGLGNEGTSASTPDRDTRTGRDNPRW